METEASKDEAGSPPIKPFSWIKDPRSQFRRSISSVPQTVYDIITISGENDGEKECLARVRERSMAIYKETDLVPGEYEGGDVVWECSIDLCRYLCRNNVLIHGSVLELGCGHGLPGIWVLKEAWKRGDNQTTVCLTDFNEFVLDSTMSNIVLNVEAKDESSDEYVEWMVQHAPLGSGDWNELSKLLSSTTNCDACLPSGLPSDGLFDCIMAAETTYSRAAAIDTARFVIRHLKTGTGVAYIATKRYYFGVGGGSDAFREGIQSHAKSEEEFQIETVQVYDNGVGNIRELLRVTRR